MNQSQRETLAQNLAGVLCDVQLGDVDAADEKTLKWAIECLRADRLLPYPQSVPVSVEESGCGCGQGCWELHA